MPDASY